MCLTGTATPTSDFPKFFQDGPGGAFNPNAGAAYTWDRNCHESFQLRPGSKGKIIMRGSGHQHTGTSAATCRTLRWCLLKRLSATGYNYNCGDGDESCNLTTNVEAVFFGEGV